MRFSSGVLYRWELERDGKEIDVPVRGRVVLQSMSAAMDAALRGLGLAYIDEPTAADHLERGELELVLEAAAVRVPASSSTTRAPPRPTRRSAPSRPRAGRPRPAERIS